MDDDRTPAYDLLPRRTLVRSNGPLYAQLADILRHLIASEALQVGVDLPKEADIAAHFGVSLITVRQALRDLAADGLIQKRSAKPAVVASSTPTMNLSWNFRNFADVAAFAKDSNLEVRSFQRETSPLLARHFGTEAGKSGYCLRSVLSVGNRKKAQITTFFPADVGSRLRRTDFREVLIFQSVQRRLGVRLAVAHVTVRAEIADSLLASDLEIAVGAPILAVEMLYQTADGRSIELSTARHPADLFSITYDLQNNLA